MVGPSINTPTFTKKASSSSTIKLLCSYGGKILPRYPDGKLRYHGGETRVLAVDRSISFHGFRLSRPALFLKLAEICGEKISLLRCQLPTEDLDALVSITSDEDLANIIEEYDRVSPSSSIKIRAFISIPKKLSRATSFPTTTATTTPAAASSSSSSSFRSNESTSPPISMPESYSTNNLMSCKSASLREQQRLSCRHMSSARPGMLPLYYGRAAGNGAKLTQCAYPAYGNTTRRQMYLVHNGNYWQ